MDRSLKYVNRSLRYVDLDVETLIGEVFNSFSEFLGSEPAADVA